MDKTIEEQIAELRSLQMNCFYDRVLVIPDKTESKTRSGIIIPDTAQEKPKRGTVVACGPDCEGTDSPELRSNCPRVKPGDRIVYGKYAGSEMKIQGIDVVLMRESDIFFNYGADVTIDLTM